MPRVGACSPWVTGEDVSTLTSVQVALANLAKQKLPVPTAEELSLMCAESAMGATSVLYELSGRKYTGNCGPVTVRPVARPREADQGLWATSYGWASSWGFCGSYGAYTGTASHYGCSQPPEITLGAYPVTSIVQVLIDGVVIPADEYELRDFRTLIRMRPTASFSPTQRWGWPTCQINDMPDSQPGTFSVTYMFGQAPPAMGVIAARKLAEFLLLPQLGDATHYPTRVTSISRQGISASVVDVMDILKTGALGIYEVDAFILSTNPHKNQQQARAWSPDLGRARRTAKPSI